MNSAGWRRDSLIAPDSALAALTAALMTVRSAAQLTERSAEVSAAAGVDAEADLSRVAAELASVREAQSNLPATRALRRRARALFRSDPRPTDPTMRS